MNTSAALKLAISGLLLLHGALTAANAELILKPGILPNEVGLEIIPNEACRAPSAIVIDANGNLAVLDSGNRRLLRFSNLTNPLPPIFLPKQIFSAEDVLPLSDGYIVLGNFSRQLIVLDATGTASFTQDVVGQPRGNSTSQLGLNDNNDVVAVAPSGEPSTNVLSMSQIGATTVPGFEPAYESKRTGPNDIVFSRLNDLGPPIIKISSKIRIDSAQVMALDEEGKAYVRVEESILLPAPQTFVKVVRTNKDGQAQAEAYLQASTLACIVNRPVAVSRTGQVFGMWVDLDGAHVAELPMMEMGQNPPAVNNSATTELISNSASIFADLELENGTKNILAISSSISPVGRDEVIKRAESLLEHKWSPLPNNLSRPKIPSECKPASNMTWRRPHYLDPPTPSEVSSVPYRWGGYEGTLQAHSQKLATGALAGNICTCRSKAHNYCIVKEATGWDCSGFVSFAWNIGYLTTSSLHTVGEEIAWAELQPGDIVNAAGSHVMLVTKTGNGKSGPFLEVLHASVACSNVCRETFAVARLKGKYQPYRRDKIF
ncbi:hypothetical protein [Chitinophaga sp.]|uniref:hypothetical protein n=1 Tax=Chitinophaga sp. TaxID=1869181 RepID=UPI002F9500AC